MLPHVSAQKHGHRSAFSENCMEIGLDRHLSDVVSRSSSQKSPSAENSTVLARTPNTICYVQLFEGMSYLA